jgi:predicted RNase H-like HicB family nuclease
MRYAVIVEAARRGFSAFVPDLPGCIATGRTVADVKQKIAESMRFHLEGLAQDGVPAPTPSAKAFIIAPREAKPVVRPPLAKRPARVE